MSVNIQMIWLLAWLGVWTIQDCRKRLIDSWQLAVAIICGAVWQAAEGRIFTSDILVGIAAGAVACVLSGLTGGGIGSGDALVLLCLGLYLGFGPWMEVLLISLVYSSVVAIYLLIFKKKARNYAIPFVPFILAGLVTRLIL